MRLPRELRDLIWEAYFESLTNDHLKDNFPISPEPSESYEDYIPSILLASKQIRQEAMPYYTHAVVPVGLKDASGKAYHRYSRLNFQLYSEAYNAWRATYGKVLACPYLKQVTIDLRHLPGDQPRCDGLLAPVARLITAEVMESEKDIDVLFKTSKTVDLFENIAEITCLHLQAGQ